MAVVKIPAYPSGVARGVWANKLAEAAVYTVESRDINFDTGVAVNIFSIPEEFVVTGLTLEVSTAWVDPGPDVSLNVQDSAGTNLALFGAKVLLNTGFYKYPGAFLRVAKTAGAGKRTRVVQVDVNDPATATAGIARVWLEFRYTRRESLRTDYA